MELKKRIFLQRLVLIKTLLVWLSLLLLTSCNQSNENLIQIIISDKASKVEELTAQDLKEDIEKVTDFEVIISLESTILKAPNNIILGTASSNQLLQQKIKKHKVILTEENPGSRGGLWHKLNENTIILAGSDEQGLQYAVYDYSKKILGIDPLNYWTGHKISKIQSEQIFKFQNSQIAPPKVPLLVYFENDVDELANLKKPLLEYDWESYTEMIDALVRMRYNGIQLFDMLGRPEFFLREAYQKLRPDYQVSTTYIDSLITYAQDHGMQVQIDMALGYQIKPLDSKYADCWAKHKNKWIDTWKYYLQETPIGKADIFAMRPRNQVWDWEYKSICEEDKIDVFNQAYATLDSIINTFKPDAKKVVICYADGMEMFNKDFNPPKDWIIAWSDDGYADFEYYPKSTKGYQFGTYMHAGFWKNHTVAAPYPGQIEAIMKKMFAEYKATEYCEVNGQQFRPFLLNLEAFSEVCRDPESFTGEGFYDQWASRYFEDSLKTEALHVMNLWEKASFGKEGYVEDLWYIKNALEYLAVPKDQSKEQEYIERIEKVLIDVKDRYVLMKDAMYYAGQLLPKVNTSYFFHDQIYFPIQLYKELLAFERILHQLYRVRRSYENNNNPNTLKQAKSLLRSARQQLKLVYKLRNSGDQNPRWKGWYDPSKRRPNNGFPTPEMLDEIEIAIEKEW